MIYYYRSIIGASAPRFDMRERYDRKKNDEKMKGYEKKTMKKRLLALLLAGLLTASMISCTTETQRGGNDTGGTEAEQTRPQEDETDAPTLQWTDADDYVYVTAKDGITLTAVDGGATVKVAMLTKLHRTRVSNSNRCEVEKDGTKYYADSTKVTTEDILGEKFTVLANEKTMYATTKGLNIRQYADSNAKAPSLGALDLNETVTVVATGSIGDMNWSKIKLEDGSFAFVSTKYLADNEVVDPDTVDHSAKFTACDPVKIMYVSVEKALNLRKNAGMGTSVIASLADGTEVTVLATGVVDNINWSKIKVADKVEEGQSPTYTIGYVASSYLSSVKGDVSQTLDGMLALYPTFTKKDPAVTMYVSSTNLNVRYTPEFPEDNTNLVKDYSLNNKDSVKVVATGTVDGTAFAMIEHTKDGKTSYYFVGAKHLTTDPSGAVIKTLEVVLSEYPFLKALETPKTVYAKSVVNCNTAPKNEENVAKKLAAGDAVTVYASGTDSNENTWFAFRVAGSDMLYFAVESMFTANQG